MIPASSSLRSILMASVDELAVHQQESLQDRGLRLGAFVLARETGKKLASRRGLPEAEDTRLVGTTWFSVAGRLGQAVESCSGVRPLTAMRVKRRRSSGLEENPALVNWYVRLREMARIRNLRSNWWATNCWASSSSSSGWLGGF